MRMWQDYGRRSGVVAMMRTNDYRMGEVALWFAKEDSAVEGAMLGIRLPSSSDDFANDNVLVEKVLLTDEQAEALAALFDNRDQSKEHRISELESDRDRLIGIVTALSAAIQPR